jgi:hypothetical protein
MQYILYSRLTHSLPFFLPLDALFDSIRFDYVRITILLHYYIVRRSKLLWKKHKKTIHLQTHSHLRCLDRGSATGESNSRVGRISLQWIVSWKCLGTLSSWGFPFDHLRRLVSHEVRSIMLCSISVLYCFVIYYGLLCCVLLCYKPSSQYLLSQVHARMNPSISIIQTSNERTERWKWH